MLYEIIEKTNEWKLGEGTLKKMWLKQGQSVEDITKCLDETRDLRVWEYNRGVLLMAAEAAVYFIVIPAAKMKINEIKTKRKLKKFQKELIRDLDKESEEEAE